MKPKMVNTSKGEMESSQVTSNWGSAEDHAIGQVSSACWLCRRGGTLQLRVEKDRATVESSRGKKKHKSQEKEKSACEKKTLGLWSKGSQSKGGRIKTLYGMEGLGPLKNFGAKEEC